jgi:hypothetical protein
MYEMESSSVHGVSDGGVGPGVARAQEDVNQLKAELENKISQLEARQKLKERAMNEKIEQATAQKPAASTPASMTCSSCSLKRVRRWAICR